MQEGQNTIFTLKSALYMQGAPVLIETGTLSLEGERAYIRLRYKNLEEKPIVFLQVRLFVLDAYGMEVKSLKRNYIHLNAEPNASFGEENAIEIASPKARRFFAHVSEVRFEDESVWTSEDSAWTIAPTQEDEDLPFRYKDLYYCRCGYIGRSALCPRCQSYLGNSVELEELSDSLDTRSLDGTQSGDAEFSKNDAETLVDEYQTKELKEEKPRFEDIKLVYGYSKKEKIKRALIATAVSVCIVGGLGLWIGSGIFKANRYESAKTLLAEGNYAEAVEAFTALGRYKDSELFLQKAVNYSVGNFKASLDDSTTEFVVPYGVTEIIPSAFEGCWWLQRVVLPDSIEKIGDKAFYGCTSLQEVQVDGCVLEIGNEAFYNCSSLESFPFPVSVSSIGERAFYCCSALESIDFSYGGVNFWETPFGGIHYIGADAFRGCNSVTEVTLPSSLVYIGTNAFSGCENLESFTLEQAQGNFSVASEGLFEYTNLKTATVVAELVPAIRLVPGVQSLEVTSGDIPDKGDIDHWNDHTEDWQTLVLREGVTSIGERAFEDASITEVVIPSTVYHIGEQAFYCNYGLKKVTVNCCAQVGAAAFNSCSAIEKVYARNIDVWQGMSFASSNANPLCHGGKLYFIEDCDLLLTVYSVSPYAFYGCGGIFAGDAPLTAFRLNESVKEIGEYAFYNCKFLTALDAPEVYRVGNGAFESCSGLKTATFPKLETVGNYAFSGCSGVESATAPALAMSYIVNFAKETLLEARFTGGEEVKNSTFYDCTALKTVYLCEHMTGIGENAFYNCQSLTEIDMPDTVGSIGARAFSGCTNLKKVQLSDSLTSLSSALFENCTSLVSLYIPASVTSIYSGVFDGCTALTTIYYKGTQSDWEKISGHNLENSSRTVYYYSETAPTESGNYWHYDENGEIVLWKEEEV
ncbi:MAG: leucine-rich repeat domain-containing protein [Clostridia bacterium]|nr:leucine-rich repeat domain-containing protein [Clostridia bacterium]